MVSENNTYVINFLKKHAPHPLSQKQKLVNCFGLGWEKGKRRFYIPKKKTERNRKRENT